MGRLRSTVPRSRAPLHRRALLDPAAVRHWLLVAAVACTVAALVASTVHRAEQARADWGRSRAVLVLSQPVERGDRLAIATRSVRWPQGLVPDGAIRTLPKEARAAADLARGSPLTAESVIGEATDGERRTVAVPLAEGHLPVQPGDRVDVWATRDPSLVADGEAATRRVAAGARVVVVADRSVVLAITPGEVVGTAEAAGADAIALVGTP